MECWGRPRTRPHHDPEVPNVLFMRVGPEIAYVGGFERPLKSTISGPTLENNSFGTCGDTEEDMRQCRAAPLTTSCFEAGGRAAVQDPLTLCYAIMLPGRISAGF